jgi:DNA-binding beta-propeller fold protein YncE
LISFETGAAAHDAIARADGQGDYVYISHNTADGEISVINTATGTLEKTITLKNAGDTTPYKLPQGMAISGNILYVANWGDNTLAMINTDTNEKLNLPSYLLSGGIHPENLVVTPDGQKLYIVHSAGDKPGVEILGY